jgi:predicted anti-sigma-YlaC factor YlaD
MRRIGLLLLAASLPACSIKTLAVNSLGNALAEGGSTYARDDDPDLVAGAIPFGLKTVEGLLDKAPRHNGLLFAAASGFTQYAFAFVQQEADFAEANDLARATYQRSRARKLYLRARDYGLRGLEVDLPGLRDKLRVDPAAALIPCRREHVRLLYWTGAAWGAAISLAKNDSTLTADQDIPVALMRRALELDEAWQYGCAHDFFIAYEGGRSSVGGSWAKAREHLDRALALSGGHRAAPLVTFAETVSVTTQNRKQFEEMLHRALDIDPDAVKDLRLSNLVAQRRARWLLGRGEELFIE